MHLIVKAIYDESFSTNLLERTLRTCPKGLRKNIRELEFRVDPDVYLDFIGAIAARMGNMADQYLSGIVGDPSYAGIPVRSDPTVDSNCIELYHPNPVQHINLSDPV